MAGGRSERMRATSGLHKALVEVDGKPLIEWNLQALIDEQFNDIVVAVGLHNPEIEKYLDGRPAIRIFREVTPLGTIGAARAVADGVDAVLVINVDNLTTLPLRRFVNHHRDSSAALTIATHTEPFQIPFGQLIIRKGEVEEYREKPYFPVQVSSGTYVLSATATALIEPERRFDITHLFAALKAQGAKICAFEHQSPWVDVNDEPARRRAEAVFAPGVRV